MVAQPPPLHALASWGLNGSNEAARRTVCYEEAATSGMTPLFVVQSARIDGMRARADAERGAAGPDKLDAASLDQNVAAFAVFAWLVADSDVSFRAEAE